MEVTWKAISGIINHRIYSSIQFHNALHIFFVGRGTETATLKEKLLQKLIAMRETVLHSIFLNLRNSYKALDRDRCMYILVGYRVGPRTLRILRTYWFRIHIAEKAGGHYKPVFQSQRGVTQGEPLSPTIFNVVVDAIIWHWVKVVGGTQEGTRQGT